MHAASHVSVTCGLLAAVLLGGRESVELCRGKRQAVVTGDSHGYIFIVDK